MEPADLETSDLTSSNAGPEGDEWRCEWIRVRSEIGAVLGRLDGELAARGYREEDRFAVRLALQEALTNAVVHGNKSDPDKQVRLRYQVKEDEILAEVQDQGDGFDPKQVADPLAADNLARTGGRGLLLLQALTSWLDFSERGTCVSLCRRRWAG
jgi:serine/threonine-protein kinase RsbW